MTFQNSSKVMSTSLKCTFLKFVLGVREVGADQTSYDQFPFTLVAGFCVSVAGARWTKFQGCVLLAGDAINYPLCYVCLPPEN